MSNTHIPVLLKETIEFLITDKNGIYIDGTIGRGGHSREILKEINEEGFLYGIDRDRDAVISVKEKFKKYNNVELVQGNYIEIPDILKDRNIKKIDGMLFDLGVSSPQFDNPERGFSYRFEAPLDMRMDCSQDLTAAEIVNNYSCEELKNIIREYGEERWADRIAKFIVKFRKRKKIKTTYDLVEVIKAAIPASARRKGGHPARRTFQALRIESNNELEQLKKMINTVVGFLNIGGRICIISFHSLEDRIVKHKFRELEKDCICPSDFPICVCDKEAEIKVLTKKPVKASGEELKVNPRARSARLRVAEKI